MQAFLRRHAFSLGTGVFCLLLCFWMITEGTGKLLLHRGFDAFYDGQAHSLLEGHWDVPPDAVSGEAFKVGGKYYGYFGFTPALPRVVLNWLFPANYGQWTRLLMLLWIASVMMAILAFMDALEVPSNPFLLTVAMLGSTLFFLCSHGIVYNEAIVTGSALALWAYLFFCWYLRSPRLGFLAVACLLSFFSFFARLTVGAGPLMVASFLLVALLLRRLGWAKPLLDWLQFPSPADSGRHAAVLVLCLGITSAVYVAVNHAKFGTWLDPAPYKYHVQYDAARLARIEGKINHLSNIPFALNAYLNPHRIQSTKSFPWVEMVVTGPGPGSAAKIDSIADYTSIPDGMPALAILSIFGVGFALSAKRQVLPMEAAALAAGCLILPNAYIAYRYLHDFYPFLVMAAILGVGSIRSISPKPLRLALWTLIAAAGIWSIAANFAFALKWQRELFWAEPAPKAAFMRFRHRVDSLVSFGKIEPIPYSIGDKLEYFLKGQLLTVIDPPATYRYDGERWNYVSGVPMHQFRLLVKFPVGQPDQHMPLWFAGRFGVSDAVYIVYMAPTKVEFCSDHWGGGGACGPATEIEPGREYHLRIDADRLNSALTVLLDDRKMLETPMELHAWKDRDILFGRSLAPSAHGGEFTGVIKRDEEPK
jgi:hypothetical protein